MCGGRVGTLHAIPGRRRTARKQCRRWVPREFVAHPLEAGFATLCCRRCLRSNFRGQSVQDRVVHLLGERKCRFSLIGCWSVRLTRVAKLPCVFG